MKKGIDGTFVQYGIKKEDMQLIEAACIAEGIDSDWVKEYILKPLNEEKGNSKSQQLDEKDVTKVLKQAMKQIK